jgi:3-phenylpropionate/trans-cinnamate dioxygenase ferredoxin subunit
MSDFVRAAHASQIKPGGLLTVEVEGEPVLIANVDGKFYAMGATCTHEEWDLSEGSADGHLVTCAGHGAVWDVRTGKAEFDEPLEDEPLFETKEEDGQLYVRKR